MNSPLPGLILILLGLLVLAGALLDTWLFSDGTFDQEPIILETAEDADPETAVVKIGGEDEVALPMPKVDERPLEERRDGFLTPRERRQVDDKGFLDYEVQRGETLEDLAERYLGRRQLWPLIMDCNRTLSGYDALRPGMRLKIPLRLRE
jgi:nucleoid-associated protein YgaU